MKKYHLLSLCFFLIFYAQSGVGQDFTGLDRSPMDIAYFPDNFAHDRKPGDEAIIRVTYSRPQMKGRALYGSLVPYGKVWRTGANEATEIKIYHPIKIQEQSIKTGTYSLFTIPGEKDWTIILNSDLDYWGAYSYQPDHDVARILAQSTKMDHQVEAFTIQFENIGKHQGKMLLAWGNTLVEVPFEF
jgi:hypothetical protein